MNEGKYKVTFKNDPLLYGIYRRLVEERGIDPREFDNGYTTVNFGDSKRPEVFLKDKEGDWAIDSQEFLDYLAVRYKEYHSELELIIGGKISWTLDDFNPATNDDLILRERVRKAAAFLDNLLTGKGLEKDGYEFGLKKAWGLFIFTLTPELAELEKIPKLKEYVYGKLKEHGITELLTFLKESPGFGVATFDYERYEELPAYEALKKRKGNCTEKSNILFAVFEEGGLNAVQTEVNALMSAAEDKDLYQSYGPTNVDSVELHAASGVTINGHFEYFDASGNFLTNKVPKYHYQLPPREMIRLAYLNYNAAKFHNEDAIDLLSEDEKAGYINDLERLRGYGTDSLVFSIDAYLYGLYVKKNDCGRAKKLADEAIRINPQCATIQYSLLVYFDVCEHDNEKAIKELEKLFDKYPHFSMVRDTYIGFLFGKGQYEKAIQKLTLAAKKFPYDQEILFELAQIYRRNGNLEKALETADKSLEIFPENLSVIHSKSVILWELGRAEEAFAERSRLFLTVGRLLDEGFGPEEILKKLEEYFFTTPPDMRGEFQVSPTEEEIKFYCKLGKYYFDREQWLDALRSYNMAIAADRKSREAHLGMYETYVKMGKQEQAEGLLNRYFEDTGEKLK